MFKHSNVISLDDLPLEVLLFNTFYPRLFTIPYVHIGVTIRVDMVVNIGFNILVNILVDMSVDLCWSV